jgi:hypothetical protein
MANVTIVKLKIRRGSDAQRKTIVLDQGEVGYTLDTRRIFVGDGVTEGGNSVGAKTVGPFNDKANLGPAVGQSPGLQLGDIGYAESKLYTLTSTIYTNNLSGWSYIGPRPDGTLVDFVGGSGDDQNYLTVKKLPGAIDSQYMSPAVFGNGLLSSYDTTNGGTVEVGINTNYLELSASGVGGNTNIIAPKINSVTEREISPTIFDKGIEGGACACGGGFDKISLSINTNQFQFDCNNKLEIKAFGSKSDGGSLTMPAQVWAGTCGENLGSGLSLDSNCNLQVAVRGVAGCGTPININNGLLSINGGTSAAQEFPFLDTRQGVIQQIRSSIYDMVTAIGLSGDNAGDGVPIGSILPHAAAFTKIPGGYLLCDGTDVSRTTYDDLFDVIGTTYGNRSGTTFTLPNLTAGNTFMYGNSSLAPGSITFYVTGAGDLAATAAKNVLSAQGFNFIIKAEEDPLMNIFNGAPDQVTKGYLDTSLNGGPALKNQVYECLDNTGKRTLLSSAGFIRFGLSGTTRSTDEDYDKFAIPVFSW